MDTVCSRRVGVCSGTSIRMFLKVLLFVLPERLKCFLNPAQDSLLPSVFFSKVFSYASVSPLVRQISVKYIFVPQSLLVLWGIFLFVPNSAYALCRSPVWWAGLKPFLPYFSSALYWPTRWPRGVCCPATTRPPPTTATCVSPQWRPRSQSLSNTASCHLLPVSPLISSCEYFLVNFLHWNSQLSSSLFYLQVVATRPVVLRLHCVALVATVATAVPSTWSRTPRATAAVVGAADPCPRRGRGPAPGGGGWCCAWSWPRGPCCARSRASPSWPSARSTNSSSCKRSAFNQLYKNLLIVHWVYRRLLLLKSP